MLLNPKSVEKLKGVTAFTRWPYTTHDRRNESARLFLEEAGKLLDQKAESTIKHLVGLYSREEIPYERYIELVEEVSVEEGMRGASYGQEYARNRVFEFAQKALEREQAHAYSLSLFDAKTQYEQERQKAEQGIKEALQRSLTEISKHNEEENNARTTSFLETVEHSLAELKTIEEDFVHQQEKTVELTKTEIEQIISTRLQEERNKREKEIQENEEGRPARDAARRAIEQVSQQERRARNNKRLKNGLIGLAIVLALSLFILLFFPRLQWAQALVLVFFIATILRLFFWKSPVSEDTLAEHKKQIILFQTKNGEYALLDENERRKLLTQRLL